MGVLEEISGKFEQNLDLIRKCFREALSGLEARENHLNGVQGSLSESSRELAGMLEAIEARAKEVEEKERESRLFLEQGWKELGVKKNELSLIRDDIRVREEKLSEQEKLIEGLFERIELEGKHIGEIRSSIDEGFRELCLKERQVADRWRELELVKKQVESRENELDKKEEKLESLVKEIEVREKVLGSKQGMLEGRESELAAREKVLELQKELVMKQRELDSAQRSREGCSKKRDSINPTPSWERTKKRRKSGDKDTYENDSEQHAVIDPGAEAAFKMIGEAHVVLSDRGKRSIFDHKITSSATSAQAKPPSHQANVNPAAKKQIGVQRYSPNGFAAQVCGLTHHQTKQADSAPAEKSFWTCCPYCNVKYLYHTDYVNKVLRCQKCLKSYVAYDIAANGVFPKNQSQPAAQGVFPGFNQSHAAAQGVFRASNESQAAAHGIFPGLNQSHAATQDVFPGSNQSHTAAQVFLDSSTGVNLQFLNQKNFRLIKPVELV